MISPNRTPIASRTNSGGARRGDVEVVIAGEIGSLLDADEKLGRADRDPERTIEQLVMS